MYQRDTEEEAEVDEVRGPAAAGPPPQKKKQLEMEMLQESGEEEEGEAGGGAPGGDAREEMELYLQDKSKAKSGPLVWWKSNLKRYPKLAKAAKRCLCVHFHSIRANIFQSGIYRQ